MKFKALIIMLSLVGGTAIISLGIQHGTLWVYGAGLLLCSVGGYQLGSLTVIAERSQ